MVIFLFFIYFYICSFKDNVELNINRYHTHCITKLCSYYCKLTLKASLNANSSVKRYSISKQKCLIILCSIRQCHYPLPNIGLFDSIIYFLPIFNWMNYYLLVFRLLCEEFDGILILLYSKHLSFLKDQTATNSNKISNYNPKYVISINN